MPFTVTFVYSFSGIFHVLINPMSSPLIFLMSILFLSQGTITPVPPRRIPLGLLSFPLFSL